MKKKITVEKKSEIRNGQRICRLVRNSDDETS